MQTSAKVNQEKVT